MTVARSSPAKVRSGSRHTSVSARQAHDLGVAGHDLGEGARTRRSPCGRSVTIWPPRAIVSQHRRLRKYDLPEPSGADRGQRGACAPPGGRRWGRAAPGLPPAAVERHAEQQAASGRRPRGRRRARRRPGRRAGGTACSRGTRAAAAVPGSIERSSGSWPPVGRKRPYSWGSNRAVTALRPVLQLGERVGGQREEDRGLQLGLGRVGRQLRPLAVDGHDGLGQRRRARRSSRRRTRRPGR